MTVVPLDSRRTQTIGGIKSPEWQRFMALVIQATLSPRTPTEPEFDTLRLGHPFYDRDSEVPR